MTLFAMLSRLAELEVGLWMFLQSLGLGDGVIAQL